MKTIAHISLQVADLIGQAQAGWRGLGGGDLPGHLPRLAPGVATQYRHFAGRLKQPHPDRRRVGFKRGHIQHQAVVAGVQLHLQIMAHMHSGAAGEDHGGRIELHLRPEKGHLSLNA